MGTLIVSIGRNVGDEPMGDYLWESFRTEVWGAVDFPVWAADGQIVFTGQGEGQWRGEDGATTYEAAYTIVALVPDADNDIVREAIVRSMAKIAGKYGQDAIAVTLGATTLAGMQHSASN